MNLKNFTATSLDGEKIIVDDLNKLIGNALYFAARDISVCDTAKNIYKGEDFAVSEILIESLKGATRTVAPWLIEQLITYLQIPNDN